MENYKNLKKDKEFFPYEYGSSRYENMRESVFSLLRRQELESNFDLIYKHMDENGVVFSSPGGSFQRKLLVNLSNYMNYHIRYPRRGENLKKDDKMRQLLEPLAKIICTEKNNLEEWKKKNPNGYGEYNYPDGKKYKGEWKEEKYHGQGTFTLPNGSKYVGKFKNGEKNGYGTHTFSDGEKYEGEFKDGKEHGIGTYTFPDGEKYEGEWKNGKRWNGQGTATWFDRNSLQDFKYEGEWKNSLMDGQGTLTIQNYEYEKDLTNDQWMDGQGTLTMKSSEKTMGEFKNDRIWNGISYDKDGEVKGKIVDGHFNKNEKILQFLDDFNIDCENLFKESPPIWHDDNKLIVFEIAKSSGYPFNGRISYKRWPQFELPEYLDDRELKFSAHAEVFKYAEQKDPKIVDWHLNFADPDLFVAYGSELLAQDEIQVAEHPILGSIREMLISKKCYAETVDDDGNPTPVTITGAQRRCVIDTRPNPKIGCPDGIYGNAFEIATEEQVRASTRTISPPTISNILAISAPSGGSGDYTVEDMLKVLNTAYTGFSCARKESEKLVPENPKTLIHTGFWGCGAFGGNRILMTILQCIAADLAKVDLEFWAVNNSGVKVAEEAFSLYEALRGAKAVYSFSLDFLLDSLEDQKFQWGESDGN